MNSLRTFSPTITVKPIRCPVKWAANIDFFQSNLKFCSSLKTTYKLQPIWSRIWQIADISKPMVHQLLIKSSPIGLFLFKFKENKASHIKFYYILLEFFFFFFGNNYNYHPCGFSLTLKFKTWRYPRPKFSFVTLTPLC